MRADSLPPGAARGAAPREARQPWNRLWLETRLRYRGLGLPLLALPLVPTALIALLDGQEKRLAGALLGIGLAVLAARRLNRGRRGDTNRAAILLGVATGLVAGLSAHWHGAIPVLLGAGAWLGTRLAYDGLPESVPPAPPPPAPVPVPAPALPPALAEARARLGRLLADATPLGDPRLDEAVSSMAGLLDELSARPDRLPQARRFLALHLDGLDRIVGRLRAGAVPPAGLPALLGDLARSAEELRLNLRREESEALEIQVKVLSDRLRQEGYA
ncbi:hypothetical protein M0638_00135 [Roseomonas sp. NAR14]|uniref:Uncharacterized protein n=1 Tax=Roseomonas acroporae TaxID=2937791 RepID=A0A9X2BRP1_9PROT|nr:hypothetical protein [Roseomonas acroporae]MCK8782788.1 hypothetical protein [Roseomonas acroporae]